MIFPSNHKESSVPPLGLADLELTMLPWVTTVEVSPSVIWSEASVVRGKTLVNYSRSRLTKAWSMQSMALVASHAGHLS